MSTATIGNRSVGIEPGNDVQTRVRTAVRGLLAMSGRYQKDLAGPIGTSVTNVTNKMTGRNKFTLEEVEALAMFFGVDIVDLLDPDRWRPHGPRGGTGLLRPDSNREPAGFRRLSPRTALELAIPTQRIAVAA